MRKEHALKAFPPIAHAEPKVTPAADLVDAVKPAAEDAHERLCVAIAEGFESGKRLNSLHVERLRLRDLKVAAKLRQLKRLVFLVVFLKGTAKIVQPFTADIESRRKRMTAEALKVLRAGGQCVKQVEAAAGAARAFALFTVEAYHNGRHGVLLSKLRCGDADDTLVPFFARQHDGQTGAFAAHHALCVLPNARFEHLTAAV